MLLTLRCIDKHVHGVCSEGVDSMKYPSDTTITSVTLQPVGRFAGDSEIFRWMTPGRGCLELSVLLPQAAAMFEVNDCYEIDIRRL